MSKWRKGSFTRVATAERECVAAAVVVLLCLSLYAHPVAAIVLLGVEAYGGGEEGW